MNKAKAKDSSHGQSYTAGIDFKWEAVRHNWERVNNGHFG